MDSVIRECRRTWHRLGVDDEQARAMADELAADLADARSDGVLPVAFVGGDPAGFARAWASARGAVRPRYRILSTTAVALVAMLPAAFVAMFVPLASTSWWFIQIVQPRNQSLFCDTPISLGGCAQPMLEDIGVFWAGGYALAASVAWCGALLGASAWLRRVADSARTRTLRALAVALPVGAIVGLALAAFWMRDSSANSSWRTNVGWPLLVVLVIALTIAGTRLWVVRGFRSAARQPPEEAVHA